MQTLPHMVTCQILMFPSHRPSSRIEHNVEGAWLATRWYHLLTYHVMSSNLIDIGLTVLWSVISTSTTCTIAHEKPLTLSVFSVRTHVDCGLDFEASKSRTTVVHHLCVGPSF